MVGHDPLLLLIDGNNLAHFLYPDLVHGQKMTVNSGRRLVAHVSQYARTHASHVFVELYLDRPPVLEDPLPNSLRLLFGEYPQTADDLLIDRFWFHHYTHHACLVITNDAEILEEVQGAGGSCLSVFDFVRRPGQVNPVFRDPQDLPPVKMDPLEEEQKHVLSLRASVYFRIIEDQRIRAERKKSSPREGPVGSSCTEQIEETAHVTGNLSPDPETPDLVPGWPELFRLGADPILQVEQGQQEPIPEDSPEPEEPVYLLDMESWPLIEGARFLKNSFCPEHRKEFEDLLSTLDDKYLRPSDLRALAELLLFACGDEPNFARQGSLMDRVRLALLLARGEPLAHPVLAQVIGVNPVGLRGRIKQKAGRWLMVF